MHSLEFRIMKHNVPIQITMLLSAVGILYNVVIKLQHVNCAFKGICTSAFTYNHRY